MNMRLVGCLSIRPTPSRPSRTMDDNRRLNINVIDAENPLPVAEAFNSKNACARRTPDKIAHRVEVAAVSEVQKA